MNNKHHLSKKVLTFFRNMMITTLRREDISDQPSLTYENEASDENQNCFDEKSKNLNGDTVETEVGNHINR